MNKHLLSTRLTIMIYSKSTEYLWGFIMTFQSLPNFFDKLWMIITDKSQISTTATVPTTQSAPSKHACEMSVKILKSSTKQIKYFNLELFNVNMVQVWKPIKTQTAWLVVFFQAWSAVQEIILEQFHCLLHWYLPWIPRLTWTKMLKNSWSVVVLILVRL